MLEYENIKKNGRQFYALTGITIADFEIMHYYFKPRCERYFRNRTLEGKLRKRPQYKERKNASLKGSANKLFFLLVYKKNQASQQLIAASFNISQGKVSIWIRVLSNIYEKARLDASISKRKGVNVQIDINRFETVSNGLENKSN